MADRIKITHRGYEVHFGQNSYTWTCSDLGIDNIDLGKVKDAIDRVCLKVRKENAVEAYYFSGRHDDKPKLLDAKIIEYIEPVTEKTAPFGTGPKKVVGHQVAVMYQGDYSDRVTRNKERLEHLVRKTPEALTILEEIRANCAQIRALGEKNRQLEKQFPRLTLDDIPALVKIANTEPES